VPGLMVIVSCQVTCDRSKPGHTYLLAEHTALDFEDVQLRIVVLRIVQLVLSACPAVVIARRFGQHQTSHLSSAVCSAGRAYSINPGMQQQSLAAAVATHSCTCLACMSTWASSCSRCWATWRLTW
jgi:hypothetical protein